jgi:hypothetical protein
MSRVLHPLVLRMYQRQIANRMEPGERMLAFQTERAWNGFVWLVTDSAVYIEPAPTKGNTRADRTTGQRIPYDLIASVHESTDGAVITGAITLTEAAGGRTFTARFARLGGVRQLLAEIRVGVDAANP